MARSLAPTLVWFILSLVLLRVASAAHLAPYPAAEGPASSDGAAVDQGIAYVLLLLALAITYLVH